MAVVRRASRVSVGLGAAGMLLSGAVMQAQVGSWTTNRGDAARSGVQKIESTLTRESLAKDFKFLWKLKLGTESGNLNSYSEPLLIFRLINGQGFKDFVIWSDRSTVYAVDSELGKVLWTKHYDGKTTACAAASNLALTLEPPQTIRFGATRKPGQPVRPAPQAGPLSAAERRIGVAAGGGGFGFKGLYWLAPDGMLHEQVVTTGADFGPPVRYVPGPIGVQKGIGIGGKVIYTATAAGCAGSKNALYAVDMTSADYPVATYDSKGVPLLTATSPTVSDDAVYVVTGKGASEAAAGVHANSVVALSDQAAVTSWYDAGGPLTALTPVLLTVKERSLLLAPGKNGGLVLLDAKQPGGDDHHTVLAETSLASAAATAPEALSVWQDARSGETWIFASVHGKVSGELKAVGSSSAVHGSLVAFKLEEHGGSFSFAPQWVSKDMLNPAPPVVANGLVIALAQGAVGVAAKLTVLDPANGSELYTSGHQIPTYAKMAGLSVGDGHVFFVTHDNTLYSFGVGMEH